MPRHSLKSLLDMFPWFFDKSSSSNFYKSQFVSNNRFRELYNDIFKVYEGFHLDKRCLVWREQSAPYVYVIRFVANYPNLKSVTLYKNDIEIYSSSYTFEEEEDSFEYSYEGNTLNDTLDDNPPIIPTDTFKIIIETWDEYTIKKGYPEKDKPTYQKVNGKLVRIYDEFDHDESLDRMGKLNNIPRKEYLIVDSYLYPSTEPPYNNRTTEDDYHYMKRMLEYNLRLHTESPVLLEVWKLYGIDAVLENREKYLLKMFDENKHLDENGVFDPDWVPQPWEHKDKFCDYSQYIGTYFFIDCSTNIPTRKQIVDLTFFLIDGAGKNITDENLLFDIYLDETIIKRNHNEWTYQIFPSYLSELSETTVKVICKNSLEETIGSASVDLRIRGCQDADIYVNGSTGSDSYDGKTSDTPFKTLQKACNSVVGSNDLIAVCDGEFTITTPVNIIKSCTLICCNENITIENTTNNKFFKISPGKELSVQDLNLIYDDETNTISDGTFTNNNASEIVYIIGGSLGLPPYVPPPIGIPNLIKNLTYSNGVISYETAVIENYSDLDGVIYDLTYTDGKISYSVFTRSGSTITDEEYEILERAVTSLTYTNKTIKFEVAGEFYD